MDAKYPAYFIFLSPMRATWFVDIRGRSQEHGMKFLRRPPRSAQPPRVEDLARVGRSVGRSVGLR